MNIISYLKKNGIKHTCVVFYQYKADLVIQKIMGIFMKSKPLQNIIMIESHNDFDSNGGAFYEYLIKNGYNKKYKIVWLLKNPSQRPKKFPSNVDWVPLFKPNIKKAYYVWSAKFFMAENNVMHKKKTGQKSLYLTHGAGGLKSAKGKIIIPSDVDYILIQSPTYAPIQAEQYSLEYPSERLVYLGYPSHDRLHYADYNELKKIRNEEFKKVILWMPTFRKLKATNRNDSLLEMPLGIPLIKTMEEYNAINKFLHRKNILMIIKIHPMQDLESIKIKSMSNIEVLTGETVKKLEVDNYKLLPCTDALISDYSGIAYEYLQVDKPIAYILNDMKDYKLGFVIDDIKQLIAGNEIYTLNDFMNFIKEIASGEDNFAERRHKVRDFIYKYHDNNNCKRLAEFMEL